ncbi:MAG: ABC transporter permease subunit, partial [Candidatus Edwardsbacteria bacterium]|nr:ABC transporter permease subunit [Candidatus Edwardsbacteria bacterium]
FLEGMRAKTLYVLFAYGLLILFAAGALTPLAMGEQGRILKDLGLAGIEAMGTMLAIVIGTTLVHKEVDKRTIYVILSKPVERYQFLAGKFLGMELLMAVLAAGMALIFVSGVLAMDRVFPIQLLLPIGLIFLKLSIINALALLFSSLASPALGAVFTACLYLAGSLSRSILQLADKLPSPAAKTLITVLYHLLPNLGNLDFKNQAVFGQSVPWPQVWWGIAYSVAYCLAVLSLTTVIFERRDAK